jgi:hypothetical protein
VRSPLGNRLSDVPPIFRPYAVAILIAFLSLALGNQASIAVTSNGADCKLYGGLTGTGGSATGLCGNNNSAAPPQTGDGFTPAVDDRFEYWWEPECRADVQVDQECAKIASRSCQEKPAGQFLRPVRALRGNLDAKQQTGSARCVYPGENPAEVTAPQDPVVTLAQFQELPIAAADSMIQPSPHTLVGAETNIFAVASEQLLPLTVVGRSVKVKATPVEYHWAYGDGTDLGPTATAGSSLPKERWGEKTRTSYVYKSTGDFSVTLLTSFRGEYSVDGGPWQPIVGLATISSPPQPISVWRSITRNYADDCNQNPRGQGCPGAASPR